MNRCVLILSFSALAAACGGDSEAPGGTAAGAAAKQAPSTTATRVEVARVQRGQDTVRIVRPGEVQGSREAMLAASLGGYIESVLVQSGDNVKKNQAIAFVDTSVHNAQANLTKVELDDAKRELARIERLGKAIASARVDAARTRVARAKAQHTLSRTRQARAVIRAPFAGVVVDLDIERGEVAAPGAPIARVIKLTPAHVSVSVTDRDVSSLKEGGTAAVLATGVPDPIPGTIHRIEPAADLRTRTFLVEVLVANADRKLLPGMMARVAFESERKGESLLIPQDFLVTRLDGNGVFVVEKEIAVWRPLTLGAIIGTQVEVVTGLEPGERVVVLGHRDLSQGDRLMVTREGMCCRDGRVDYAKSAAKTIETSPPTPTKSATGAESAEPQP